MSWFPILLAAHITLAIALLLPSVVLPFVLRRADGSRAPNGPTRALMALQGTGSLLIGAGVALTGIGLLLTLGLQALEQPWLLVALTLYAINLGVAAFVSRPNLRKLIGMGASPEDDATWRRRARTQRWVAYGMAAVIGLIGFLMSAKPELWLSR